MYESPIEIIQHKIRSDISNHVDDAIYTAVVRTDIHVDRDELIKALRYDRGQYEKGFSDGLEEGKPKWLSANDKPPKDWKAADGTLINYLVFMPEYGVDVGNYLETAKTWVCMGLPVKVTHWMPLHEPPKEG